MSHNCSSNRVTLNLLCVIDFWRAFCYWHRQIKFHSFIREWPPQVMTNDDLFGHLTIHGGVHCDLCLFPMFDRLPPFTPPKHDDPLTHQCFHNQEHVTALDHRFRQTTWEWIARMWTPLVNTRHPYCLWRHGRIHPRRNTNIGKVASIRDDSIIKHACNRSITTWYLSLNGDHNNMSDEIIGSVAISNHRSVLNGTAQPEGQMSDKSRQIKCCKHMCLRIRIYSKGCEADQPVNRFNVSHLN